MNSANKDATEYAKVVIKLSCDFLTIVYTTHYILLHPADKTMDRKCRALSGIISGSNSSSSSTAAHSTFSYISFFGK